MRTVISLNYRIDKSNSLTFFLRVDNEVQVSDPENIYYMGRKIMNYETFPYPIYNLQKHDIFFMKETKEEFKDANDIVFYEVALSKDDSYLVTGNIKHFPKVDFVVTPGEMMEIIRNGEN